jgi:hypothetical protein
MLPSSSKTNKLFVVGFIKLVEEATCLLSIVVVSKKNGKVKSMLILGISTWQKKRSLPIAFYG